MGNFNKYKAEYLEHLVIKNFAEKTIANKERSLRYFIEFLAKVNITNVEEIFEKHLEEYKKERHYYENAFKRQDCAHTQNKHLITIKDFFKYLKKNSKIAYNVAENLESIKESKSLPQVVLCDKEIRTMIDKIDTCTILGYRNRTMMEVLYTTGMRNSELRNLKDFEVNLEEGIIKITQGKGRKDRIVPIGKLAVEYLGNYMKFVRQEFLKRGKDRGKGKEYLFMTTNGNKMDVVDLVGIVKSIAKDGGIEKKVTPHVIRRTCATEMIRHKANLMYVKELLGHESLESIKPYCRLNIMDLKEAHKRCHPREQGVV